MGARAVGALIATAVLAWLAGNMFVTLRDGYPATNTRTACTLWACGLVACAIVLWRGVRRRPFALASTLLVAAMLGGSIALSVAAYPASVRSEERMQRAPAAPPIPTSPPAP